MSLRLCACHLSIYVSMYLSIYPYTPCEFAIPNSKRLLFRTRARTKGAVGSGTGMDGVFLAVNQTKFWIALQVGALFNNGTGKSKVLFTGDGGCRPGSWCELSLAVDGAEASARIDGEIVRASQEIPAPYEHFTSKVAGDVVPLGKGGYASFGVVGYSAVEFDRLRVISSK